jgi:hypothetical protein
MPNPVDVAGGDFLFFCGCCGCISHEPPCARLDLGDFAGENKRKKFCDADIKIYNEGEHKM